MPLDVFCDSVKLPLGEIYAGYFIPYCLYSATYLKCGNVILRDHV